eukprot:CAMPEP_0198126578 /NCGR_PEP_ID=MMETSP1442-20131203/45157_1 /TAXON_ID= /ORGANISM="Craspedostauros australis, Strain CCMP3328" /LENGTH=348 /DNA_ID=CAMNT_0043786385 /DNA_START=81 /DNA_END=1130 /DNA_ORIENTATION=-
MGDRKVVNKYIPADFDPSLVPKGKKLSTKDGTVPVRMMLPFSVQCETCNTFMYRGRKFNSKKEPMGGPDGKYLGIQRFRFYIKCTHCSRSISFLTDPQNADYEMESGGTRNYEVYKDKEKKAETSALEKEKEEKLDPMKALENRVLESQREMADLDNLEEIRAMNRKHVQLMKENEKNGLGADAKSLLDRIDAGKKKKQTNGNGAVLNERGITAEDEELIKSIKFGGGGGEKKKKKKKHKKSKKKQKSLEGAGGSANDDGNADGDDNDEEMALLQAAHRKRKQQQMQQEEEQRKKSVAAAAAPRMTIVKKKRKIAPQKPEAETKKADKSNGAGLSDLLGGYGSGSDSD